MRATPVSIAVRTMSTYSRTRSAGRVLIDLARRLLETADLSIDQVADRVDIGSASSLRVHLGATLDVPPSAYRRTFRSREDRTRA